MIFDTHAHYDDPRFDEDRETLFDELPGLGVGAVTNIGASLATSRETAALAKRVPYLYGAVGVHPSECEELSEEGIEELRRLAANERIVAIGETGLDYYGENPARDVQAHWFRRQLSLARDLDLPVVVHSRDAAEDTMAIVQEHVQACQAAGLTPKGVIHCFSYSVEHAKAYADMGFFLGIGGVLTFKNARKLVEVVQALPLSVLVLETDCPYLAPAPHRGERNSSAYLPLVAAKIAELKECSEETVLAATWDNALRLYGLGSGGQSEK